MHPPHHYRNISFTCTHSAEDWVAIVTSVERYIEHLVWSVPFWNAHPLRPSSEEMRVQTKDMDYTASSNPHLALQIFLLLSLSALTCHYRILLAKVIKRLLRWVFWSMQSCNFLVMVLHDLHFFAASAVQMFFEIKVLTGALLKRCSITGKVKLFLWLLRLIHQKCRLEASLKQSNANPVIQSGYDVKSFVKLLHCWCGSVVYIRTQDMSYSANGKTYKIGVEIFWGISQFYLIFIIDVTIQVINSRIRNKSN